MAKIQASPALHLPMNRVIACCLLTGILWTSQAADRGPLTPANSPAGELRTTLSQAPTGPAIISIPIAKTKPAPNVNGTPWAGDAGTSEAVASSAPEREPRNLNGYVLRAIEAVPPGGGYAVTEAAMANLRRSIRIEDNGSLSLTAAAARPSFCSSATYLVFLKVIEQMETRGQLKLSTATKKKLLVESQPDGVGVWGRWNANGPGTARLFYELKLGRNFTELSEAQPGDFLKIWWTDAVGAREKGHSVIFLGTRKDEGGGPSLLYWSSNIPMGFGQKAVQISRIKHMVFSRFERPGALYDVDRLPARDAYLASMLSANESFTNLLAKIGATSAAASQAGRTPHEAGANR
jgi:hypothetical protein